MSTVQDLQTALLARIAEAEARVLAREPSIHSLLPEQDRFERLRREARALVASDSAAASSLPLFGVLFAVKDIFHVDGFPTRAGSRLPPGALRGDEAEAVSRLKAAGALMIGKTVTTEFAYFTPGPTRNPHNVAHTPGGSSSGSAAAVAAGFCGLALGSQTIGSIIRPAAFCGVVGLKPTYGRISMRGIIPVSPSLDHAGCLAADVDHAARAARVLYTSWREVPARPRRPVLGIPEGPYLESASADALQWFERVCEAFTRAGYDCRRVPVMRDFQDIRERHLTIMAAEMARVHEQWFRDYAPLYSAKTADLITAGRKVTSGQLDAALAAQAAFRRALHQSMVDADIDAWICPSTSGPAPLGLESTGDPVMNLPWTHAGLPALGLPAGRHRSGLPMGLQIVGRWNEDERLLADAGGFEAVTTQLE